MVANDSVWTDRSTYQVGDTISVCVATNGGKVTLVMSGPYTLNINLGTLPAGSLCVPIGQAEQRDVGPWTVSMYVSSPYYPLLPGSGSGPSATTYFVVENSATPEFSSFVPVIVVALIGSVLVIRTARRKGI